MSNSDTLSFAIDDFQADVIEASREQPVLVDFWAPWCGPCRTLGPTLEKLAREPSTRWKLAKVNVDDNPDVARRYGVRGIPSVKLFASGTVVDEFTGALPEHAIRKWLEEALPSPSKERLEKAKALLDEGQREEARALLQKLHAEEPENDEAKLLLARLLVFADVDKALELVEEASFTGPESLQTREAVETVARLLAFHNDPGALPEGPPQKLYGEAIAALAERDFGGALERFIQVIQQSRDYDEDGARKACVALFTLLGEEHPAVRAHRRAFDMSLY